MADSITAWIRQSEQKIREGETVTLQDLGQLEVLTKGKQQHLLYIWAAQDRIDSGVIAWNYFGPFDSEYGFDPGQHPLELSKQYSIAYIVLPETPGRINLYSHREEHR